jgi:hypothetical protein
MMPADLQQFTRTWVMAGVCGLTICIHQPSLPTHLAQVAAGSSPSAALRNGGINAITGEKPQLGAGTSPKFA